MRYVIIGNSAAGIFAAEAIRKLDPAGRIDILSDENYPTYARCMTSYYLGGDINDDQMYIRDENYYTKNNFNLHLGQKAAEINSANKEVVTIDGDNFQYDRLLIATGASPIIPKIKGIEYKGIFGLRTLADAKGILEYIGSGKNVVIVGGGLVAMEAAYALQKAGKNVTCVEILGQILSQALDGKAADIVGGVLSSRGMQIKCNTEVIEFIGENDEIGEMAVKRVKLGTGEEIPADVVIMGVGVTPNIDFLVKSGIDLDYGIKVNEYLETSVKDVYAAGDVAQGKDILSDNLSVNPIWPNATEQGKVAGMNMAGTPTPYSGSIRMNSLNFYDLSSIAAGLIKGEEKDGYEVVRLYPAPNIYRKLVFKDDKLVGFIMVGQTAKAGILTSLVKERVPLGKAKAELKNGMFKQKFLW